MNLLEATQKRLQGTGASNLDSDNSKVRKEKEGSLGNRSASILLAELRLTESTDPATLESNTPSNMVTAIITKKPYAPDLKTTFLTLIETGKTPQDIIDIKHLIQFNAKLVETDDQYSPITLAAQNGCEPIFQIVLENHTQTPQNFHTDKALFNVCNHGTELQKLRRFTQLLEKKWKFDHSEHRRRLSTVLSLIHQKVDFTCILKAFPDLININGLLSNKQLFLEALLEAKNTKMIKHVINCQTFEPNTRYTLNIRNNMSYNMTYLADACRLGLFDIASELVFVNSQSATITSEIVGTPLHAISFPHSDKDKLKVDDYKQIIKELCIYGHANVNEQALVLCFTSQPDFKTLTPLQAAIVRLNVNCVKAFFEFKDKNNYHTCEDTDSLQHLALSSIDRKKNTEEDTLKAVQIITFLSGYSYQITPIT